MNRTRLS